MSANSAVNSPSSFEEGECSPALRLGILTIVSALSGMDVISRVQGETDVHVDLAVVVVGGAAPWGAFHGHTDREQGGARGGEDDEAGGGHVGEGDVAHFQSTSDQGGDDDEGTDGSEGHGSSP